MDAGIHVLLQRSGPRRAGRRTHPRRPDGAVRRGAHGPAAHPDSSRRRPVHRPDGGASGRWAVAGRDRLRAGGDPGVRPACDGSRRAHLCRCAALLEYGAALPAPPRRDLHDTAAAAHGRLQARPAPSAAVPDGDSAAGPAGGAASPLCAPHPSGRDRRRPSSAQKALGPARGLGLRGRVDGARLLPGAAAVRVHRRMVGGSQQVPVGSRSRGRRPRRRRMPGARRAHRRGGTAVAHGGCGPGASARHHPRRRLGRLQRRLGEARLR